MPAESANAMIQKGADSRDPEGGRPGRLVALRADMDAFLLSETSGLSFASHERSRLRGREVDVTHVCGHDTHTVMLMAAVLASMKDRLSGDFTFLFQPLEEGLSDTAA